MRPQELYDLCQRNKAQGSAVLALVKPPGRVAGFPRGELACVNMQGQRVYHFPIDKLLKWLAANFEVKAAV